MAPLANTADLGSNLNLSLKSLMGSGLETTSDFICTCQAVADALCQEIGASAVEVKGFEDGMVALAGAIPASGPMRLSLSAAGRAYGCLSLWLTDPPSECMFARIQLVASVISIVLERKSLRKDKQQFIHSLTHDLRGILVRSSHMAELLGRAASLQDEGRELQTFLMENLASGESLLRQLSQFASVGSSEEPVRDVTIRSIVESVRWYAKPQLASNGVTLRIDNTDLTVSVREREITDVLQQVVDNSIKFGASEITVDATQIADGVLVSVNDDGPGIEPAYAETVFEPLRRLHGSSIPGHGLGLPIARKIVELHGGRMWVESRDGRGTEVRIWLPAPVVS